ncbi:MAG: hypothetical protein JSS79_11555 [Bacteroidetes bacterium]|nr:hypothetical protein [Bacteroidota bacterium]
MITNSKFFISLILTLIIGCSKKSDSETSNLDNSYSKIIADEGNEFEFDHDVTRKYAITALEEYNHHNPNQERDFSNEYAIDRPYFCGRYFTNCSNEKIKVIIVVFINRNNKGSAQVKMVYDNDNYFNSFLGRVYSSENATTVITDFRTLVNPQLDCDDRD